MRRQDCEAPSRQRFGGNLMLGEGVHAALPTTLPGGMQPGLAGDDPQHTVPTDFFRKNTAPANGRSPGTFYGAGEEIMHSGH